MFVVDVEDVMKIQVKPEIREAITKAVHYAIDAVGGIDGLKKTSMFGNFNKKNK